jgi:hypothetical protein
MSFADQIVAVAVSRLGLPRIAAVNAIGLYLRPALGACASAYHFRFNFPDAPPSASGESNITAEKHKNIN